MRSPGSHLRFRNTALAVLAALTACRREPATFANPDADMAAIAAVAIAEARDQLNIELTYQPDSVATVEDILAAYHELYRTGELNDELAKKRALRWGAYIGEAIKRETGEGLWSKDHSEIGPNTFPIRYRGGESFPVMWAFKRITIGPEENVWHKYLHFVRGQDEPGIEIIRHP